MTTKKKATQAVVKTDEPLVGSAPPPAPVQMPSQKVMVFFRYVKEAGSPVDLGRAVIPGLPDIRTEQTVYAIEESLRQTNGFHAIEINNWKALES